MPPRAKTQLITSKPKKAPVKKTVITERPIEEEQKQITNKQTPKTTTKKQSVFNLIKMSKIPQKFREKLSAEQKLYENFKDVPKEQVDQWLNDLLSPYGAYHHDYTGPIDVTQESIQQIYGGYPTNPDAFVYETFIYPTFLTAQDDVVFLKKLEDFVNGNNLFNDEQGTVLKMILNTVIDDMKNQSKRPQFIGAPQKLFVDPRHSALVDKQNPQSTANTYLTFVAHSPRNRLDYYFENKKIPKSNFQFNRDYYKNVYQRDVNISERKQDRLKQSAEQRKEYETFMNKLERGGDLEFVPDRSLFSAEQRKEYKRFIKLSAEQRQEYEKNNPKAFEVVSSDQSEQSDQSERIIEYYPIARGGGQMRPQRYLKKPEYQTSEEFSQGNQNEEQILINIKDSEKMSNKSQKSVKSEASKPLSKLDQQRLSKRSLQLQQESLRTPSNQGFNMSQRTISDRVSHDLGMNEAEIDQVIPVNSGLNAYINNGVIARDPNPIGHEFDMRRSMLEINQRMLNTARNLGLPDGIIQRIQQLPQRLMQVQQVAQEEVKQVERIDMLSAQNSVDLQSKGNNASDLPSVLNSNSIIKYRDQQEVDRRSLNGVLSDSNWSQVMNNALNEFAGKAQLSSQQRELLSQSLGSESTIVQNLVAASVPNNASITTESNGSRRALLRPDLGVQEDDSLRTYIAHQIGRIASGNSSSSSSSSVPSFSSSDRLQNRGQQKSGPEFGNQDIENFVLGSINDLELPFSADNQNPGENPFNNWLNALNNANNNPVDQKHPYLPNKIVLPRPAITIGDLAKFIAQSMKFVSEISGPISNVILSTYKKQTSVFKGKVEKKETTSFKVKPGAMFRVRAC